MNNFETHDRAEQMIQSMTPYAMAKRIIELESMAPTQPERQIDWSKIIGRLVMVRNECTGEWEGPEVLHDYRQTPGHPFYVADSYREEVKLYDGPTRPNWVEWSGGTRPVDAIAMVLVEMRNKEVRLSKAKDFRWGDQQQYSIVRYSVIEP